MRFALALLLLFPFTTGSATAPLPPAVACDMHATYAEVVPVSDQGEVTVRWRYHADAELSPGIYGDAACELRSGKRVCELRMRGDAPTVNDVCGLARLGHEAGHAMGAEHERLAR